MRLRRMGLLRLCRASEAGKAVMQTQPVRRDDQIVTSHGCFHDTLRSTLTACSQTRGSKGAAQAEARYAINPTFVWITARDGSIHATRPPIIADGQVMLCGHTYDRRDLRIRIQAAVGLAPVGACPVCGELVAAALGETETPARAERERKPPLWP